MSSTNFNSLIVAFPRWVQKVTNYASNKVIWYHQNMPRPKKPYVGLHLFASKQINREYVGSVDINGNAIITTHKEWTLRVQAFADLTDPLGLLIQLQDSLLTNEIRLFFEIFDIVYVDALLNPQDTSVKFENTYEQRATMDLRFRLPYTIEDKSSGVVDSIQAEGIMLNQLGLTISTSSINMGSIFIPTEYSLSDYVLISINQVIEKINVKKGTSEYYLKYLDNTTIELDGSSATINDLLPDDVLDIVYYEYLGNNCIKSIEAERT